MLTIIVILYYATCHRPGAYRVDSSIGRGRATAIKGRPNNKQEIYTDSPGYDIHVN